MSSFRLDDSIQRAERRLRGHTATSRPRRDRGRSRLPAAVLGELERLLRAQERPPVREVLRDLSAFCRLHGLRAPARATVYKHMQRTPTRDYPVSDLPPAVRVSLYNLAEDSTVPGHQLAFYCLNYGDLQAASFAAGLPWLALYQAARLPGWRPRSRGVLEAILRARGIQ